MNLETNYDDIRPYNDAELAAVYDSLIDDDEFLSVIATLKFGWLPDFLFPLFKPFFKAKLRGYASRLNTVVEFQDAVEHALQNCLDKTSDAFVIKGHEKLDPDKPCLFISNHRDIVLDPALCNLALHRMERKTCRIAIGDNLLSKPFAEHLMRINKSFIVKRSVSSGRERLKEMKKLSSYIRQSILVDQEPVWIAQREGRAKDGIDQSDPAMIKMLALSKPKDQSFAEAIRELNIIPVSISYEWDPCDTAKARELASKHTDGNYQKSEHEDIESIAAGIQGNKGCVELQFGQPLTQEFETADDVAAALDTQIVQMYGLHPSNIAACNKLDIQIPAELLESQTPQRVELAQQKLAVRTEDMSDLQTEMLLRAYANPVLQKAGLIASSVVDVDHSTVTLALS